MQKCHKQQYLSFLYFIEDSRLLNNIFFVIVFSGELFFCSSFLLPFAYIIIFLILTLLLFLRSTKLIYQSIKMIFSFSLSLSLFVVHLCVCFFTHRRRRRTIWPSLVDFYSFIHYRLFLPTLTTLKKASYTFFHHLNSFSIYFLQLK